MRKVFLFNMVSLDGFFEGPDRNINWHHVDAEFNEFAIHQLDETDALLFGRVTYQLMASYWPTLFAREDDPIVAGKMNSLPKFVFSRTLDKVEWENSSLVQGDIAQAVSRLKQQPGQDLALFGSGVLAASLTRMGLIDEFRMMVNPVALGNGRRLFQDLSEPLKLNLIRTRVFASGNVLLVYQPEK
ncbi:MAG: dihydrofolate reductase family protein [Anaerolineae bacterium]